MFVIVLGFFVFFGGLGLLLLFLLMFLGVFGLCFWVCVLGVFSVFFGGGGWFGVVFGFFGGGVCNFIIIFFFFFINFSYIFSYE